MLLYLMAMLAMPCHARSFVAALWQEVRGVSTGDGGAVQAKSCTTLKIERSQFLRNKVMVRW